MPEQNSAALEAVEEQKPSPAPSVLTDGAETLTAMDSAPISPAIQTLLDALSAGDLELAASSYHPEAMLIFNRSLAGLCKAQASAIEPAGVKALLRRQIDAGTKFVELRDYVQGKDLAIVRSTQMVEGVPRDAFDYYLLHQGKIRRHVAGIYEAAEESTPSMPPAFHPVFMEQMGFLAAGDADGLAGTYATDAIWAWAATNSPIARVRGASQGRNAIQGYLARYLKLNMQMVQLKEYTQVGDVLFVQAVMTATTGKGIAEHASGAYVFAGNKIARQASSCGPRA